MENDDQKTHSWVPRIVLAFLVVVCLFSAYKLISMAYKPPAVPVQVKADESATCPFKTVKPPEKYIYV